MFDLVELKALSLRHGAVARVVLADVKGSAPRGSGTSMLVWADGFRGTIGGGRLEYEALITARKMLENGGAARLDRTALGPQLNQCCGGAVSIVTEVFDTSALEHLGGVYFARRVVADAGALPGAARRRAEAGRVFQWTNGWLIERIGGRRQSVHIYGAGHVGRALAGILVPLHTFDVNVIDGRDEWIDGLPDAVATCADDPLKSANSAEANVIHFIVTHDHDLDLALCHALLSGNASFIGLIGSATKWARFKNRLRALGHTDADIARITCPIGDPGLGKDPQAIAVGVAAGLLRQKTPAKGANGERE